MVFGLFVNITFNFLSYRGSQRSVQKDHDILCCKYFKNQIKNIYYIILFSVIPIKI